MYVSMSVRLSLCPLSLEVLLNGWSLGRCSQRYRSTPSLFSFLIIKLTTKPFAVFETKLLIFAVFETKLLIL